ncbi:hypothetical protein J6590_054129 [Homalodisca vitripennis]|nr:hypothetical protein J6590_054129 [Homalodisca vitripennis]
MYKQGSDKNKFPLIYEKNKIPAVCGKFVSVSLYGVLLDREQIYNILHSPGEWDGYRVISRYGIERRGAASVHCSGLDVQGRVSRSPPLPHPPARLSAEVNYCAIFSAIAVPKLGPSLLYLPNFLVYPTPCRAGPHR